MAALIFSLGLRDAARTQIPVAFSDAPPDRTRAEFDSDDFSALTRTPERGLGHAEALRALLNAEDYATVLVSFDFSGDFVRRRADDIACSSIDHRNTF